MKKGEEHIGVVEKVDFPNKGVVLAEDRKVIVKNTIPGQSRSTEPSRNIIELDG